eukprot:CAMPEP_0202453912 /NCGR_PEP_ID=MMETSP1360-20130828/11776_1 /ASSEMBLY_ACC=CAM_ASM_000848 /TAXON_ID=515479 /ORGANISM="Licmophora paradoxa, Strain CCMP2313" /LENGTH=98 /DNA_ID=CAMNT_0049073111 /DNA_START=21 /DNA_END=317 /DNA_ORIENTATION=-
MDDWNEDEVVPIDEDKKGENATFLHGRVDPQTCIPSNVILQKITRLVSTSKFNVGQKTKDDSIFQNAFVAVGNTKNRDDLLYRFANWKIEGKVSLRPV